MKHNLVGWSVISRGCTEGKISRRTLEICYANDAERGLLSASSVAKMEGVSIPRTRQMLTQVYGRFSAKLRNVMQFQLHSRISKTLECRASACVCISSVAKRESVNFPCIWRLSWDSYYYYHYSNVNFYCATNRLFVDYPQSVSRIKLFQKLIKWQKNEIGINFIIVDK